MTAVHILFYFFLKFIFLLLFIPYILILSCGYQIKFNKHNFWAMYSFRPLVSLLWFWLPKAFCSKPDDTLRRGFYSWFIFFYMYMNLLMVYTIFCYIHN